MSLLAFICVLNHALGAEPPTPARAMLERTNARESVQQLLDDGIHHRFGTEDSGPVHVWRPRAYRPATAATIIYLHGFYTDVDQAIREHRLISQFRDSARNALFIIPETRSGRNDPLLWPDLEKLLSAVEKRIHLRPSGPIILVGHSGAYRSIAGWLRHKRVTQVLLVDGMYGNDADFKQWLEGEAGRQLVLVSFETQQHADWFIGKKAAMRFDTLPWLYDELPAGVRRAQLVNVQSERMDHMQLVTDGRLLPWLLHAFDFNLR